MYSRPSQLRLLVCICSTDTIYVPSSIGFCLRVRPAGCHCPGRRTGRFPTTACATAAVVTLPGAPPSTSPHLMYCSPTFALHTCAGPHDVCLPYCIIPVVVSGRKEGGRPQWYPPALHTRASLRWDRHVTCEKACAACGGQVPAAAIGKGDDLTP